MLLDQLRVAERAFKNGVGLKALPPASTNFEATKPVNVVEDFLALPDLYPEYDRLYTGPISPKRTLIIIHGIIDRVYGFVLAPMLFWGDLLGRLQRRYENRVYAFDHPTLTEDPAQNAAELLGLLPDGITVDILCHSRGGLVTRSFLQQVAERKRGITIGKVIYLAAANQGSPLAERRHLADLLSIFSTFGHTSPVPLIGATLGVAGHLMLGAARIAAAGLQGLPGLSALVYRR